MCLLGDSLGVSPLRVRPTEWRSFQVKVIQDGVAMLCHSGYGSSQNGVADPSSRTRFSTLDNKRNPVRVPLEWCLMRAWMCSINWTAHGSATPSPWYFKGPYTRALGNCFCARTLFNPLVIMGAMMWAHSFLVSVVVMRGYSMVFMIVELRQYQASSLLTILDSTALPHSSAFCLM